MANGVYIAVSGAQAELRRLDVVSNNLANNNTPGFKKDRVNFKETLANAFLDDAKQDKRFVEVAGTHTDMSPGPLRETGNPLDLALLGDGFFKVQTSRGQRLMRGGTFMQNTQGQLVTTEGNLLLGSNDEPITIPPNVSSPIINGTGKVIVGKETVGNLAIVEVKDIANIKKEEAGTFATNPENIEPATNNTQVHQGYIESGNGDAVRMMITLVETQRHYDTLHRAIETYKDLDQKVTRIVS